MHGMVTLGLEQKLIAVPIDAPPAKIAMIARAMVKWLAFEPRWNGEPTKSNSHHFGEESVVVFCYAIPDQVTSATMDVLGPRYARALRATRY